MAIVELFQKVNSEDLYNNIGKNILVFRKEKQLTQLQIAQKLNVTAQQVQKYENGNGQMYVHTLIDISKILGTSVKKMLDKGNLVSNVNKINVNVGFSSNSIIEIFKKIDAPELYVNIGKNILFFRKKINLTQLQIAKKLNVTPQQVQKYENGKGSMYVHTLIDIAGILSISIDQLLDKDASVATGSIKLSQKSGMRDSGKTPDEMLNIDKTKK
ncbi:helix-turn-helix domain-containing protein [Candidatus Deianiraea vastatrix]|uniref:Transcriptional regulator n=1 Tax=Candidatus Deianiraea vastatrix TaxID=2163644 RepID=A0A5B8XI18_9RICK|nr:helix-turn-helix transcriptional regulator [Candidatus Deianiraea vastatrix]QED23397.1 Putative transcriptional regulator [Candidatus Deianiraea vastatrix]